MYLDYKIIADRKIGYFFVKINNTYVKITYNIMKKNYNKDFQKLSNWYTVDDVGYRGKMFYLSDLLFHVIGFGWFSCPSLFIGLGRFLWCQHQIYLRYNDILALISCFIISISMFIAAYLCLFFTLKWQDCWFFMISLTYFWLVDLSLRLICIC